MKDAPVVLSSEIVVTSLGMCAISLISWGTLIAVGFSVKAYTFCETVSVIHVYPSHAITLSFIGVLLRVQLEE